MLRPLCLTAVLSLACLATAATAAERRATTPRDPEVWITMDSAELAVLQDEVEGLAGDGVLAPLESFGEATLARTRESHLAALSSALHERYHRCGGFTAHFSIEDARKTLYSALNGPVFPLVTYTIDNPVTVNAISANVVPANICSTITTLSAFHTRYYQTQIGFDAAAWIKQRWEQIAAGRSDITVSYFDHPNFLQHSVVLRIKGTEIPHESVVLGAHLDSIRSGQPSNCNVQPPPSSCRAPGADDDASGIASLTETLRAALAVGYKPARTVFFIGYAGEEAGLLGSKDIAIAMNPAVKQTKAPPVGALQLDMTNFKSTAGTAVDVGVLNDANFTNGPQNTFIANLISAYQPTLTVATNTSCGYGCSDHASWTTQAGVPASIAFEGRFGQHSQNLHSANDTLANMDTTCNHGAKFSRIGAAYMAELAKGGLFPLDGTR
ncbi:MAG: M20/M25/M40 family metallo-hydrolase [Vicinamibacteria bacterium]